MVEVATSRRRVMIVVVAAATVLVGVAIISGLLYHWVTTPSYRPAPGTSETAMTTYKGDNARTGGYTHETQLTTASVAAGNFGKRVSYPVDGAVFAQPLYVPGVSIHGHVYDVVYVATWHDSVYAFDADATSATSPLWKATLLEPGEVPLPLNDAHGLLTGSPSLGEIGITGTPVIDAKSGTLYVVSVAKKADATYVQRLHALDVATGNDRSAEIAATVPGRGIGGSHGAVAFDPLLENQRAGLLLLNGVVYIAWGSYVDRMPFHGWVMGYDAAALKQVAVFNTTPNGEEGGIWQSGGGLVASPDGNAIFFSTGNGTFDLNTGGADGGDTVFKLSPKLQVIDYFAPFNQECMSKGDFDLGSGGIVLLPSQARAPHPDLAVAADKQGRIYVLDQHNLGHFVATSDPCSIQDQTAIDRVVQETQVETISGGAFSTPAYWQGPSGAYLYFTGRHDHVKAFAMNDGRLSNAPTSQTPESFGYTGGNVVISSNGASMGSGIAWVIVPVPGGPPANSPWPLGVLRAYDATNLGVELYHGDLPSYMNFTVPTVASGEVFVGTGNTLEIFGFLH